MAYVVTKRSRATGEVRYEVRYRVGGRGAPQQYAGRFKTREEAEARARAVELQLASSAQREGAERLVVPPSWDLPLAVVGYVYAISAPPRSTKIGWSENPLTRFRRLDTESSRPLRLLRVDVAFSRDLEYELHALFRDHRKRGEWFVLPEDWQVTWAACVASHHAKSVLGVRARALGPFSQEDANVG